MGLNIYGIAAAQNVDHSGETIDIDGLDISRLRGVRDEHDDDSMFRKIGAVKYAKKIKSLKDCENEKQQRCWNFAQVPMVYVEGELADDMDHPDAKATASMLKFAQRPDVPLDIGFSIDGGVVERKDDKGVVTEDKSKGKYLAKSVGLEVAITVKRCNPKCKLFLENDMQKSLSEPIPAEVIDRLRKSKQAATSMYETYGEKVRALFKLQELKDKLAKSIDNYHSAFTGLNCKHCGETVRFFKSTNNLPVMCKSCKNTYSLSDIWNSLNK